jgi:hypothetical protein
VWTRRSAYGRLTAELSSGGLELDVVEVPTK